MGTMRNMPTTSPMGTTRTALWALALVVAASLSSCEIFGDGGKKSNTCDPNNPEIATCCDFPYKTKKAGKEFGESCTTNSECAYGKRLLPGEGGNLTNDTFGFCTRGCDCENNAAQSRLTDEEKASYTCIYPPGNEGGWHHVLLLCDSPDDCQDIDPQWTDCYTPSSGTLKRVCQAMQ